MNPHLKLAIKYVEISLPSLKNGLVQALNSNKPKKALVALRDGCSLQQEKDAIGLIMSMAGRFSPQTKMVMNKLLIKLGFIREGSWHRAFSHPHPELRNKFSGPWTPVFDYVSTDPLWGERGCPSFGQSMVAGAWMKEYNSHYPHLYVFGLPTPVGEYRCDLELYLQAYACSNIMAEYVASGLEAARRNFQHHGRGEIAMKFLTDVDSVNDD